MFSSALLFSGLLGAAVADALPDLHLPYRELSLDCGLRVLLHPSPGAALISTELRLPAGARAEPTPGLAHLVEHLMFEGSAHAPDAAYDRWLARVGADSNAWTDHDQVAYTAVGPPEILDLLLFLESDRLGWPTVTPEDLDNQLAVVFSERDLRRGLVGGLDAEAIAAWLYPPDHPYRRSIFGDPEALAALSPEDVLRFQQAAYLPADAVLVIGGDLDLDATEARVRAAFADLPPAPPRPAPSPATPLTRALSGEQRAVLYDDTDPTLVAVWPTVPRGHPDEPALDLLADVLTDRLPLGGRAWTDNRALDGRLTVQLSHPHRSADHLRRRLDAALRRLLREGISAEELAHHQRRWRISYVRAAEGLEDRVALLAACAAERGEPDCIEPALQAREALTPDDLLRVARAWLGEQRLLLSVVSAHHPRRALRGAPLTVLPE